VTVHHIHVNHGAAAFGRSADLLAQTREVCRQNRGCQFDQRQALLGIGIPCGNSNMSALGAEYIHRGAPHARGRDALNTAGQRPALR